jgi:hypothetical protein
MLNDLIELTTTAVHRDHSPDLSHPLKSNTSANDNDNDKDNMPPRRRRASKSQSISSATAGDMLPPALPITGRSSTSKSPSPVATRTAGGGGGGHRRATSTSSNNTGGGPGSPASARQLANALTTRPPHVIADKQEVTVSRFVAAAVMSLVLSSGLRTLASTYTTLGRAEIAAISDPAHSQNEWYVGGLLLWRILVLGVYWFSGYDGESQYAVKICYGRKMN